MFHSDTYGKLELSQIPDKITDYFNRMKHYDVPLQIIVGTDSQNFSDTKMVSVIAVICIRPVIFGDIFTINESPILLNTLFIVNKIFVFYSILISIIFISRLYCKHALV